VLATRMLEVIQSACRTETAAVPGRAVARRESPLVVSIPASVSATEGAVASR
jgi:hypothetical protein